jgi:hypothetical protein
MHQVTMAVKFCMVVPSVCVGPQYGPCFMSPSWHLHMTVALKISTNAVHPWPTSHLDFMQQQCKPHV